MCGLSVVVDETVCESFCSRLRVVMARENCWAGPPDSRGRLSPHVSILLLSTAHMRAAAIFGLGCSAKNLTSFQTDGTIDWRIGLPAAADQADIILLFGGDGT